MCVELGISNERKIEIRSKEKARRRERLNEREEKGWREGEIE